MPIEPPPESPSLSFKGWLFSVWLVKNADFVKKTITLAAGATPAVTVIGVETLKLYAAVWGAAASAIAVKLAVDAVHYFLKENPG